MMDNFPRLVEMSVTDFLLSKGLVLERTEELDGGNKSLVVYGAPFLKICFYRSQRDGEINCLIGSEQADNDELDSREWVFLRALLSEGQELSIEELLASVPAVPKTDKEQLEEIMFNLKVNFDDIVKKISKRNSAAP